MNAFVDATVEPVLRLVADWSVRWAVLIGAYAVWLCPPTRERSRSRNAT